MKPSTYTPSARTALLSALALARLLPAQPAAPPAGEDLLANGGFEQGFTGWTRWGANANLITLERTTVHAGSGAARIQHGRNALYCTRPVTPGQAYELRFFLRLQGPAPAAQVALGYATPGGALNSAGRQVFTFPLPAAGPADGWREIRQAFLPPSPAATCQFAFTAALGTTLWLDDVSLRPIERPTGLAAPPSAWAGLARRTTNPLFRELLGPEPGGYWVTSWSHDLNPKGRTGSAEEPGAAALPEAELREILAATGAAGLGFMNLPGWLDGTSPLRTAGFFREQSHRHGVHFDVWSEGSGSIAAGLKHGAEILNAGEHQSLGKRPVVSWVDPNYVEAQTQHLRDLGRQLRDEPFVGVYYGKDEPTIPLPQDPFEQWGNYSRRMAAEVRRDYGDGRLDPPQPRDKGFQSDPTRFLRWLAYNRWANDRFIATRTQLSTALHEAHPAARYSPANYWFMNSVPAYDYSRLAACSDVMELDPYASSAERNRGRGVFNHGFGAKFMTDLTDKPVRIVAQAFDYAGYAMTPDDLREWVSQSLRCGASAITYYTLDRPRTTRPDRWRMMLHLAQTLTRLNRLRLPAAADTVILYTLYTHMSQGDNSPGDQLYSAHALLGELGGSWFKFIADAQLERGERQLAGCKVVYLPLARYMTPAATRHLEDYVRAGGTLVCGDAEAFSADLAGRDTTATRERLLGLRTGGPRAAGEILLRAPTAGLAAGSRLQLFELKLWDETSPGHARSIEVIDPQAEVLGTYPDGAPAIVRRPLGRGHVITFAANPFAPQVTVDPSLWPAFFQGLQRNLGCQVDQPIWRFLLPAPAEGS